MYSRNGWDLAIIDLRATGERIFSVSDYSSLTLGRTGAFFNRINQFNEDRSHPGYFYPNLASPNMNMLELMSLRYVVATENDSRPILAKLKPWSTRWRTVHRGIGKWNLSVFENTSPLPRAYVAFQSIEAADGASALDAISKPRFNPRITVVIEGSDRPSQGSVPRPIQPAKITSYRADAVTIEVRTDEAGYLVLTDSNYPGWIAEIDGRPVETLFANYLFRAVEVPAGSHRVTFRYEPRSVQIGAAISMASLALLAAVMIGDRIGARRFLAGARPK